MSLTTTLYSAAMRSVYEPRIREQLNNEGIMRKFRKQHRDDVQWQGNEVVVHLHSDRNQTGVKSTGESGLLGVAGNQSYDKLQIPIRDIKARFGITSEVINASEHGTAGAAAPALTREMEGITNDIERQLNRQLFGFGQGTLGVIATGATSATQTVKDPGNVVGTVNPLRFIKAGQNVAITDVTGATIRDVQTVSTATATSNSLVLAGSVATTTGDLISLGTTSGSTKNSSFGKEMMGLLGIVDSSTYVSTIHGLTRSSKAFFQSGVQTSVGALSEDLLYRTIQNQEEVSGEKIDTLFCHPSIEREYYKLTQADRRYTGSDLKNPDAGVDMKAKSMFGNVAEWVTDKDAPYGTIIGAVTANLFVIYLNDGQWEDFSKSGSGGELLRFVADKTDYEGVYLMYLNAYSDVGHKHFRMDGVSCTISNGVVAD